MLKIKYSKFAIKVYPRTIFFFLRKLRIKISREFFCGLSVCPKTCIFFLFSKLFKGLRNFQSSQDIKFFQKIKIYKNTKISGKYVETISKHFVNLKGVANPTNIE